MPASPRALTPEHRAAIDRFPTERPAGGCGTCGRPLVRVILEPVGTWPKLPAKPVTPRHACAWCEVALAATLVRDELWAAVLRHPVDSFWRWIPPQHRQAFAEVGFGLVVDRAFPDHQLGVLGDALWAGEGRWALVHTGAHASLLRECERGLGWSAAEQMEYRLPPAQMQALADLTRGFQVAELRNTERGVCVGAYRIQRRLAWLVNAIWPRVVWHARGPEEPIGAFWGEVPVAMLMPMPAEDPDV